MRATENRLSKFRHVYAIVRIDRPVSQANPENSVAVVKVYRSKSLAEQEVSRLSKVNSEKGCLYTMFISRMIEGDNSL